MCFVYRLKLSIYRMDGGQIGEKTKIHRPRPNPKIDASGYRLVYRCRCLLHRPRPPSVHAHLALRSPKDVELKAYFVYRNTVFRIPYSVFEFMLNTAY